MRVPVNDVTLLLCCQCDTVTVLQVTSHGHVRLGVKGTFVSGVHTQYFDSYLSHTHCRGRYLPSPLPQAVSRRYPQPHLAPSLSPSRTVLISTCIDLPWTALGHLSSLVIVTLGRILDLQPCAALAHPFSPCHLIPSLLTLSSCPIPPLGHLLVPACGQLPRLASSPSFPMPPLAHLSPTPLSLISPPDRRGGHSS